MTDKPPRGVKMDLGGFSRAATYAYAETGRNDEPASQQVKKKKTRVEKRTWQ